MFKTTLLLANGDSVKEDFLTAINQLYLTNNLSMIEVLQSNGEHDASSILS